MAQNMYRVGDFVYFETSSSAPFQIRKIEELTKNAAGQVEAKVVSFYRRREIHPALLKIADQAERKHREFAVVARLKEDDGEDMIEGETEGERYKRRAAILQARIIGGEKIEEDEDDTPREPEPPTGDWGLGGLPLGADQLNEEQRHRMRLRELFVSRNLETLPATHIRGKCFVTLLNEIETYDQYDMDDHFFYSLMYDPTQKTLLADKGAIRLGKKYQCDRDENGDLILDATKKKIMERNKIKKEEKDEDEEDNEKDEDGENGELMIHEEDDMKEEEDDIKREEEEEEERGEGDEREVLVYHPHHSLTDRDIDQFLIIARAVGTFSRALDTSSSSKLPSLHMTAAAASRDVTLLHAMALLHQANYDIGQAVKFLVPPPSKQHYPLDADKCTSHKTVSLGGPILCRDQMEEWSAAEANLFEEALDKYGKDFNDVRNDFLPWKSIRDIVEYYYMWKTTNRYVDQKKAKNQEMDKLKQVYIPNYNKPNAHLIGPPNTTGQKQAGIPCESCATQLSLQWYSWGPPTLSLRLCTDCWGHWKKMGGLHKNNEHERHDIEGPFDLLSGAQQLHKLNSAITTNPFTITNRPLNLFPSNTLLNNSLLGRSFPPPVTSIKAAQNAKHRISFCMRIDPLCKMARKLSTKNAQHPHGLLNLRQLSRKPFLPVDHAMIRSHCHATDQPTQLKVAMSVLKASDAMKLPQIVLQAISTHTLFSSKRPSGSNGSDMGAPTPKRQNISLA